MINNYAQIVNNKVVNVIVADENFIASQIDKTYVLCNRGGIDWTFDGTNFIPPQPYASWTLDSNYEWQPPTPKPDDVLVWTWNETSLSWEH